MLTEEIDCTEEEMMVFAALQVPGALGVLGYKVLGYKVKRPSRKESVSKEVQRGVCVGPMGLSQTQL